MNDYNGYPILTADEAANLIPNGTTIGFSGFSPAGAAKALPPAIARRAKERHAAGEPYQVRVFTGASTGPHFDDALAEANAISFRAPYQSSMALRKQINAQKVEFVDMHLSHVTQHVYEGFYGAIDFAVVEASEVTRDGRAFLTTSIGVSPTYLKKAQKIIFEINRHHNPRLREMADIAYLPSPPHQDSIAIHAPMIKIGWPYASFDPDKVIGIVETDEEDHVSEFSEPTETHMAIARHVVDFVLAELKASPSPNALLPFQSGVGNVANAVMSGLGNSPDLPPFYMYSEVLQDALIDLIESGKILGASTCSLTLTERTLQRIYQNMDFFAPRIVLRPQELSNNPGIVRRLGVITMNTALEFDIYGNVNSTHVCGTRMMNGIGGSGDFTRNAYVSFFTCPSTAKGGKISAVVPMATHIDHSEHSVQIVATEQGLADLRGLGPMQRAEAIINNCAHPDYRPYLREYLKSSEKGHIRHNLKRAFELHCNLLEHGAMLPELV
ncbi:MAG: succinate CoA transferase [Desulfobacterales bacterium]|nr:succinate CoA transferase [Desulfobacterales bacterium]